MAWAVVVGLLSACAGPMRISPPASEVVRGSGFLHGVVRRQVAPGPAPLHVYLAGDGRPWVRHRFPAADPDTPDEPVLALLALDPGPALLLGRPCYHGLAVRDPACHPWMWTHGRYSEEVVDSLEAALRSLQTGPRPLVFIGYSGGATLALLLARRFPSTRAVLTVAGNLDPDAWTGLHGYSPLVGSQNPAREPPLGPGILQWHLSGGRDVNIPTGLVRGEVRRQGGELWVYPAFDHRCCWARIWPDVLSALAKAVSPDTPPAGPPRPPR